MKEKPGNEVVLQNDLYHTCLHDVSSTRQSSRARIFNMAMCGEEIDFRQEAQSIISDINFAVQHIDVSRTLDNSKDCVYMNIVTLEGLTMCVRLSTGGLKVQYDTMT